MQGITIKVLAEWDTVSAVRSVWPWKKKKLSFVKDKVPQNVEHVFHAVAMHEKRKSFRPMLWKEKVASHTKVEQCAFVGCHSDIGGGTADPGLSTLTLLWMVSRIEGVCGAGFDYEALLPFVTPLQASSTKNRMQLNNLAITKGTR